MKQLKIVLSFLPLFSFAIASAQCDGKTTSSIIDFTPIAIDSIVESAGLCQLPKR